MTSSRYIGRFAPTPSGPLHFGSLVAAVGSYLQARTANGAWLLRIEDVDQPRASADAAEAIISTLAKFGFEWSGPVEYQSRRVAYYAEALATLKSKDLVYPCSCSRSQIATSDEQRYPGTCRDGVSQSGAPVAQRFEVPPGLVELADVLQGAFSQDVLATSGDFVVQRRDGYFAYHLAVVVDDAHEGITEVVRGADLLDSTPRHILLQQALQLPTPRYCHLPLAVDSSGHKLSKSAQSLPIDPARASEILWRALDFLRQAPPSEIRSASLAELWQWAQDHWTLKPLARVKSGIAPTV